MTGGFLTQVAVFLAAAAIAAPIAKKLNISSVLGYLAAGILIGPFGLGFVYSVYQVENILHIAEFGVALLLFLIGLELKPRRLWMMRGSIFGLGGSQVLLSAVVLTPAAALLLGISWPTAVFLALALSLSSTAFVLQVLDEKRELSTKHGRAAFSVLLFQDLAAIPLIAMVPLLAGGAGDEGFSPFAMLRAIAAILVVIIVGRYALSTLYRLVASTGVREAMTASALLTVVAVALLMEAVGLSPALGAFLAGALLADSPYRHQVEADIAPFEGLLLGLFFTAVGMSLNLNLLAAEPVTILAAVIGLLTVKGLVLYVLGRWRGLDNRAARRLALAVSQGGEFAFVLLSAAFGINVIDRALTETVTVIVTISMLSTPVLLLLDEMLDRPAAAGETEADEMPEEEGHVIVAGFGRFGQIVARILRARGIAFTALDESAEQVAFVSQFGSEAYYGDVTRINVLRAARIDKARAFVLALDDPETSLKTAEVIRTHYPDLPIYARARDRNHAHRLMDLGIEAIRRETFLSALDLSKQLLSGIGFTMSEAARTVELFQKFDERRLYDDYAHYTDLEKIRALAKQRNDELAELFELDQGDFEEAETEAGKA